MAGKSIAHPEPVKPKRQRKRAEPKPGSALEVLLLTQIQDDGLPKPEIQYRLIPGRRHRVDVAWPEWMVCMDVQGGTWANMAHNRGGRYADDCFKANEATLLGWAFFRVTRGQIESGEARKWVKRALANAGAIAQVA